jgi:GR25 family glycosyltransferase involved in LPS biosynthesis
MLSYFDKVYCIHLPNAERRKAMDAEFARVGIKDVTYVHADAPPAGFTMSNMRRNPRAEFGVSLSHIKAIVQAIDDRAIYPLFVEDDVTFNLRQHAGFYNRIVSQWWDVLYLGGHPREPVVKHVDGLVKVGKFSCAEAYSIRNVMLVPFVNYWLDRCSKPNAMFDFILGEFAANYQSFCVYPTITEQRQVVSHVSGTVDDKRELIARGWKNNLA